MKKRKYRIGDRVRLNHAKLKEFENSANGHQSGWYVFDAGTISKMKADNSSGYGSEHPDSEGKNWGVRWDGYDYGDSDWNCHTADEVLLIADEPDEDELAEALASIEQAARKTMSTRRLP